MNCINKAKNQRINSLIIKFKSNKGKSLQYQNTRFLSSVTTSRPKNQNLEWDGQDYMKINSFLYLKWK